MTNFHIPPQAAPHQPPLIEKLVGMSFVKPNEWPNNKLHHPENLQALASACSAAAAANGNEWLAGVLRRNPYNPSDANAVEVHWPPVGMIGHIKRDTVAWLAPLLDKGARFIVELNVRIAPGHEHNPGVDVRLTAVA
jgi:HIRAN domain